MTVQGPHAELRTAWAIEEGRVDSITILPTSGCNMRCAYCYRAENPVRRLDWPRVRSCLEWAQDTPGGILEVNFTGGEPLLEFELIRKSVVHLRNRRERRPARFRVLTNGLLLDDRKLDFIVENGIQVHLSFDGTRESQESRHPGSWTHLDRLLRRLAARYPDWWRDNLQVTATLTPRNLDRLAESTGYFLDKGVENLGVSPALIGTEGLDGDHRQVMDDQLHRVRDLCLPVFDRTGRSPFLAFRRRQEGGRQPDTSSRRCAALDGANPVLDADGELGSCLMFARSGIDPANGDQAIMAEDLLLGREGDPGFTDRLRDFPRGIRRPGYFSPDTPRFSRYRRCRECPVGSECRICPLALMSDEPGRDPDRVPAFLCAWYELTWTHRNLFPVQRGVPEPIVSVEQIRELMTDWWHGTEEKSPAAAAPGDPSSS